MMKLWNRAADAGARSRRARRPADPTVLAELTIIAGRREAPAPHR